MERDEERNEKEEPRTNVRIRTSSLIARDILEREKFFPNYILINATKEKVHLHLGWLCQNNSFVNIIGNPIRLRSGDQVRKKRGKRRVPSISE